MVCGGQQEGGISPCSGDSGGPLACPDDNGDMYLAGKSSLCAQFSNLQVTSQPLKPWGGGRCTVYAPPSFSFCLLLKIIMRHPYLKILDLANLFVADAPMKKIKKFSFTPLAEHFEIWV